MDARIQGTAMSELLVMNWEVRWLTEPVDHLPASIVETIWRPSFWHQDHDARAAEVVRLLREAGWSRERIEAELLLPIDPEEPAVVH